MQKHWKLFTTSLIVALTLASFPQAIQGMEVEKHEEAGAVAPLRQRTVYKVNELHGGFQDGLPRELMQLCFLESSKWGADPRVIERVCKGWCNAMRYIISERDAPLADLAGIPYTTKLNDIFMEDCMRRYREGLVFRATLFYKRGQGGEEQKIRFSDFKDGTADLSECGDEACKQVYTTSRERFLEVGGANEGKFVTFMGPCHLVEDLLPAEARAHIVFLWRWCGEDNLSGVDYLATGSIVDVSSKNVFENWCDGRRRGRLRDHEIAVVAKFSCLFGNQN